MLKYSLGLMALIYAGAAAASEIPPPLNTPTSSAVDEYFGIKVSDPYRWLETATDPNVGVVRLTTQD